VLQELYQVVHHALVTDLQFVPLIEFRCVIKGFQAFLSLVRICRICQELSQTEKAVLAIEVILQVDYHITEHTETVQLNLPPLRYRPAVDGIRVRQRVDIQQERDDVR
jgi:hypothetical protein